MTDPEFRQFCNTLDALAFLPTADLQEGITYIRSITPDEPVESDDLVDYFDTTYVSGTYRPVLQQNPDQQAQLTMRRVPPMFHPSVWSVHNATKWRVTQEPTTFARGGIISFIHWLDLHILLFGLSSSGFSMSSQPLLQLCNKTASELNPPRECYRN